MVLKKPVTIVAGVQAELQSGDVLSAADSEFAKLGAATYSTVQQGQDVRLSTGVITGGGITDDADGTITVAAGTGFIRATDSDVAELLAINWPAESGVNVAVADGAVTYLYVEYNGGTPRLKTDASERSNFNTNILLGSIARDGFELHLNANSRAFQNNYTGNNCRRLMATQFFARESGGILTETGTRNIIISAGAWWECVTRFTTPVFNSADADRFRYHHRDGIGGWTLNAGQSQINNTQWDDGDGGLADLSNNKYGIGWVYLEMDGDVDILYGQGDYTITEANEAPHPSTVPDSVAAHGRLLGRIIIKKNDDFFTSTASVFTTDFIPTTSGGDTFGPPGAVSGNIAEFNDTTGKVLADSGKSLSDLQMAFTATIDSSGADYTDIDDAMDDFLAGNYDTGVVVLLNDQSLDTIRSFTKPIEIAGGGSVTLTLTAQQTITDTSLTLRGLTVKSNGGRFNTSSAVATKILIANCNLVQSVGFVDRIILSNGPDTIEIRNTDFANSNGSSTKDLITSGASAVTIVTLHNCTVSDNTGARIIGVASAPATLTTNVYDGSDLIANTFQRSAGTSGVNYDASSDVSETSSGSVTFTKLSDGGRVTAAASATNYTPAVPTVAGNLSGVDAALGERVAKALFDANSILAADSDDTPTVRTIAVQQVVGRITAGNIKGLSVAELQTLANVEDGADVTDAANVDAAGAVMEVDFNAQTILAATSDDTPAALTVGEQTLVGRITAGNVAALTATQVRTLLNVQDGSKDGDVVGPATATADAIALYDGTSGTLLKDGVTLASLEMVFSATVDASGEDYTDIDTALTDFLAGNYDSAIIVLKNNQSIDSAHTINKPLTIIGENNQTLTMTGIQTVQANVSISNLSMQSNGGRMITVATEANAFTFTDCSFTRDGSNLNRLLLSSGIDNVEFRNCTFADATVTSARGIVTASTSSTLTVSCYSCTVTDTTGIIFDSSGTNPSGVFNLYDGCDFRAGSFAQISGTCSVNYDKSSNVSPIASTGTVTFTKLGVWYDLVEDVDFNDQAASASTITMVVDWTGTIKPGMALKIVNNSVTIYAVVKAITPTLLTIYGPDLSTTDTHQTGLSYGPDVNVHQAGPISVLGNWCDGTDNDLLENDASTEFIWRLQDSYLVGIMVRELTNSGSPVFNISNDSLSANDVLSTGLTVGTSETDSEGDINSTNYLISNGAKFFFRCTTAVGSGNADLVVHMLFVEAV